MKLAGVLLLLCSGLVFFVALSMDTSVATGGGERVHNIGLLRHQSNAMMLAGVLFVGGIVLYAVRGRDTPAPPAANTRKCTYCAEPILIEAIKCRFCGSDQPQPAPDDLGRCPNCDAAIPMNSHRCKHCIAEFGPSSAWQVKRM